MTICPSTILYRISTSRCSSPLNIMKHILLRSVLVPILLAVIIVSSIIILLIKHEVTADLEADSAEVKLVLQAFDDRYAHLAITIDHVACEFDSTNFFLIAHGTAHHDSADAILSINERSPTAPDNVEQLLERARGVTYSNPEWWDWEPGINADCVVYKRLDEPDSGMILVVIQNQNDVFLFRDSLRRFVEPGLLTVLESGRPVRTGTMNVTAYELVVAASNVQSEGQTTP